MDIGDIEEEKTSQLLNLPHNISIFNFVNLTIRLDDIDNAYPDFSQIAAVRGLFVCMFLIEFVVSVFGNLLVCVTVYQNKSMHSAVNYGIVNLGICDFLVGSFVLPTKLFELTAPAEMNMMNDLWCTVIRFLESLVVFVSVFTLVAICVERYYAVVFPMHSRIHMTDYRIRKIILMVWIIPTFVAAPNLYPATAARHYLYSEYGEFTRLTCFDTFSDNFRLWYFLFLFFFMYVLPLLFIGTTCFSITRVLMREIPIQSRRDPRAISLERGRRKVAKMVLVIVFTFIFCWSPYFLVTIVTQLQTENYLHNGQFFFTMLSINLLCFTNSCVNPFVYFAMSTRFRKGFICILRSMRVCSTQRRYSPDTSLSSLRRNHRGPNGHRHHRLVITTNRKRCTCNQQNPTNDPHRGNSASGSASTNNFTGNSQEQFASYHRHRHLNSTSSHTIVFEFHQFRQSTCNFTGIPHRCNSCNVTTSLPFQESSFLM